MVAQHGRQPPANCDAENGSDFPGEPFHTEVVELVKLLHTKMRNELENSPDRKHTMEFWNDSNAVWFYCYSGIWFITVTLFHMLYPKIHNHKLHLLMVKY